ncbi:MAG: tetratricopeptide repeat protein [Pseudomonadota bacterium]
MEMSTARLQSAHVAVQFLAPIAVSPERLRLRQDMIALVRAGKLKSALALGEAQLAVNEATWEAGGKVAVEFAGLLTDVSELHQALHHVGTAEAGYRRAISLYSNVQYEYPEMLRPTVDLAILYRSRGKPELALPLQLSAYPKLLAWLGPEHPDVIESEGELVQLHQTLKQYHEATVLLQARLDRAKRAGDRNAIADNRKALTKLRHARPQKRT